MHKRKAMVIDGGTPRFTVVYTDSVREFNFGTVAVDPAAITFKDLLSLLSDKIGISPHSFSVFLATVGTNRKVALTANVNLAATMPLGGTVAYYFLIVKRPSSSRRSKKSAAAAHPPSPSKERKDPQENVMLLSRAAGGSQLAAFPAAAAPPFSERAEIEMRMNNLLMERERFLMNMAINDGNYIGRESSNGAASIAGIYSGSRRTRRGLVCKVCLRAAKMGIDDRGFHPCIYDEVILGFRTSAGSISRPPARIAFDSRFPSSRDKFKQENCA